MKHFRYGTWLAIIFIAYVATGLWGLSLQAVAGFATLVWAPAAIALIALYFGGYRLCPAIALGALVTNVLVGAPPLVAAGIAFGNTLEALVATHLLRQRYDFNPLFRRLKDSIIFIAVCTTAPLIAASLGTFSLYAGGVVETELVPLTWLAWWMGDGLSLLVIGAFAIRWLEKPLFSRTRGQLLEMFAAFATLLIAHIVAITDPIPLLGSVPIIYFFVPFLWLSVREGARSITFASVITGLFFLLDSQNGIGLFADAAETDRLFLFQLLLGMLAAIFLVISSAMEERRLTNKELEKNVGELERALKRLRDAARTKNEFMAILAHELRNPLAALISSLELYKKNDSKERTVLIDTIDESAQTMRQLLDDLLDISRISRRGFSLKKKRVDLIPILRTALAKGEARALVAGNRFSVSHPTETLWIDADPLRIEQTLHNLLSNAVKYTPASGHIEVSCTQECREVVIAVRDNGIGIERERLPYIFEPFQRSEDEALHKSLGIGLFLSEKFARLHGGSLLAESEGEGKGSTFTLRLPLVAEDQLAAMLPETPSASAEAYPRLDILVVDDNAAAAQSLAKLLGIIGHRVSVAPNGSEALEQLRGNPPQVAIIDIGLPDIDGYTVAVRALEEDFTGTLIALSGYGQPEDKSRAHASGFRFHITKPASLNDIENVLRKIAARDVKSTHPASSAS